MHLSNAKPVGDIGGSSEFTTRSWLSDGITYDIFRVLCLFTGNFHSNFLSVILLSQMNQAVSELFEPRLGNGSFNSFTKRTQSKPRSINELSPNLRVFGSIRLANLGSKYHTPSISFCSLPTGDCAILNFKNKVLPEIIFLFFCTVQKISMSTFKRYQKVRKIILETTLFFKVKMTRLFITSKQNRTEAVRMFWMIIHRLYFSGVHCYRYIPSYKVFVDHVLDGFNFFFFKRFGLY